MIPRETINKAIDYILPHLTAQIKEIYAAYQNMYNVWFPKDGTKEKLLARNLFTRTVLLVLAAGWRQSRSSDSAHHSTAEFLWTTWRFSR
ncbi:hypothetical protein [uncultured Treponema sp.]|uniref:hypothetical protein n=1 Tax=uncultured Treponema sp. TaxID=162155 RepID=UPI00258FF3B8|nr:hypothetical protein [uncultured Treponema sp.]